MIGLVEQLLIGKPVLPSQPVGTDEQQSPKEVFEKEASFLAMLVQLFGSIVQPVAQKLEATAGASSQVAQTVQPEEAGLPLAGHVNSEAAVNGSAESALSSSLLSNLAPRPTPAPRAEVVKEQPTEATRTATRYGSDLETAQSSANQRTQPGTVDVQSTSVSPLDKREVVSVLSRPDSVSESAKPVEVEPSDQILKDSRSSFASSALGNSEDEAPLSATQTEKQIPTFGKEEARGVLPDGSARARGDNQSITAPQPAHVVEPTAEGKSKQTRAGAELKNPTNPLGANANDHALEASEPVREGHRDNEAVTASAFPVDWGKMKLTVRSTLPVHQFTPAETTVALKAVADSFSMSRAFSSKNNSHVQMRSEPEPSVDLEAGRDVMRSAADVPEDLGGETDRKPDLVHETAPPIAADSTLAEGEQDWSTIRMTRKEHGEHSLQAATVRHPVEGTEKNIAIQSSQPTVSTKAEGVHGKEVSTKGAGATIELPKDFARDFVVKIADDLRLHVAGRTSEVRVRLKPEHLGALSLKVTMQEGELAARMDVTVPAVKAALDAQLPQLREALASQGIEIRRFDVVADGQGNAQREQQRFHHQPQSGRQTDVDATETYAAMRDLGYNTVEYII